MTQGKRRSWTETEITTLCYLWGKVGSVALIAIMMRRSPSSVQTQASRSNLPPRAEEKDRHRRRWGSTDDGELDTILKGAKRADGMIPIEEVAAAMHRSVDAVVARLVARHGEDSDIMARLVAPPMPLAEAMASPQPLRPAAVRDAAGADPKKQGRMKACLKCRRSFWSEGRHNWICPNCKRPGKNDRDYWE